MLISDDEKDNFLVDCGSKLPKRHMEVPHYLSKVLTSENSLLLSHYHTDHYNLIDKVSNFQNVFQTVYVPDLPFSGPGSDAAHFIRKFLEIAVITGFSQYRVLPKVLHQMNVSPTPLRAGCIIKEVYQTLKILWPDITSNILNTPEIKRNANDSLLRLQALCEQEDITYDEFRGEDITSYFTYLARLIDIFGDRIFSTRLYQELTELEDVFKKMANLFSIIATSYYTKYDRMLLLADATEEVLNYISIPGSKRYKLFKSAHHGTNFGYSLSKISTKFLVVSRSTQEFQRIKEINRNYFTNIDYEFLLSTEHLGHCLIN